MKNVLLLFSAFIAGGSLFAEPLSLNVNFGITAVGANTGAVLETTPAVGAEVLVPGRFWNNALTGSGKETRTIELNDSEGEQSGATLSYTMEGVWWAGSSATDNAPSILLRRYLSNKNDGWSIKVSNIPYRCYDVYCVFSSNQGQGASKELTYLPVNINGSWYSGGNGVTLRQDANWTGQGFITSGELVEGKNYLKVRVDTAAAGAPDELSISTKSWDGNNSSPNLLLAAVQIVEIPSSYFRRTVSSSGGLWFDSASWACTHDPEAELPEWVENVDWINAETGKRSFAALLSETGSEAIDLKIDAPVVLNAFTIGAASSVLLSGDADDVSFTMLDPSPILDASAVTGNQGFP